MQTIQTIIGPKTSRTRDLDGAFQNDGKIDEREPGRAIKNQQTIAIKKDVSKNITKKKNKKILYRLSPNTFYSFFLSTFYLLIYFIAITKSDRSST